MKRSEMIERLTCFLSEEQGYREDRSYAEIIIVFLESQGMQPPKRIKYAPTAYAEPNKRIVYEWEDEE
jgi:hypothetical protein